MPLNGCHECEELWQRYSKATLEHAKLIHEQQDAAAMGNVEIFRDLELAIDLAERERERAGHKVREHEAVVHGFSWVAN